MMPHFASHHVLGLCMIRRFSLFTVEFPHDQSLLDIFGPGTYGFSSRKKSTRPSGSCFFFGHLPCSLKPSSLARSYVKRQRFRRLLGRMVLNGVTSLRNWMWFSFRLFEERPSGGQARGVHWPNFRQTSGLLLGALWRSWC